MKIVVLNGSPRPNGNTEIMTDAFVRGAEEAGHQVVKFNLGTMKIAPCLACEYCASHGGVCVQKDDIQKVSAQVDGADMLVFASPVYWFTISAQLKTAIDRLYAFGKKQFTIKYAALLLDSASDKVYRSAIAGYEDTCAYLGWENKGIVTVYGMKEKGDMKGTQGEQQAYELGKIL